MDALSRECVEALCPCGESCPLGEALSMIGGRWKLRILCGLQVDGPQRYNDISRKLSGVSPTVLSQSLKELERDGLISRTQYEGIPVRVEYGITERGSELWPILHRLAHWAKNEPFDGDHDIG